MTESFSSLGDLFTPQLLSPEQLAKLQRTLRGALTDSDSKAAYRYREDVPVLLRHLAAQEQATRYLPVAEALPTKFNDEGRSDALLVCTDGKVNIFPHNYYRGRNGKPGYWIQVGQPHHVTNVTHWREFPADPAPAVAPQVAAAGPAGT